MCFFREFAMKDKIIVIKIIKVYYTLVSNSFYIVLQITVANLT